MEVLLTNFSITDHQFSLRVFHLQLKKFFQCRWSDPSRKVTFDVQTLWFGGIWKLQKNSDIWNTSHDP